MTSAILAFALGVAWLQQQGALPAAPVLAGLAVSGLLLLLAARRQRLRWVVLPLAALCLGVAWAGWMAQLRMADALSVDDEGRDIEVVGVIAGLPDAIDNGLRFAFDVETASAAVPSHVSLAWYRSQGRQPDEVVPLRAGERWRFVVRMKRPHGNLNPHGFDFEAWLLERNIRATGSIKPHSQPQRLEPMVWRPGYLVERLRQATRERFETALPGKPFAGILAALAMGDQRAIDADYWRTFSRTGTTHLMSISGLHVTMVAGLIAWIVGWLWRRSPRLPLRLPAQKAAVLAGFLGALGYSLLAGFAVPAQRTLYMLTVVALALWSGRRLAGRRVLGLALLAVLLLDPWAVLAAGFWLSFGAVALLFYAGNGRLGAGGTVVVWLRAQWAVTVGMLPMLLALFQQFSLVSPLANAVAIPVVSLLVTPLALVGSLPLLDPLLWLAHGLMVPLMAFLEWLAASDWAVWQQAAPPLWAVVLALAGALWLLLPRGFPARWLGLLTFLPLLLFSPERPAVGAAKVVVLDVGQGLAVHVQTARHDLLFDAGPIYSAEADSGSRVIVPYLRAVGVGRIDELLVTHEDKDHSGGAESVLESLPVGLLRSSLPFENMLSSLPVRQEPCLDGQGWEWDGVRFDILHPTESEYRSARKTNTLSCVLKISTDHGRVLLTSDIEAPVEADLLARHGGDLKADILLAPHHGSRSSSTPEFIAAVGARTVIFPVGYRNRFGHPKPEVEERYRQSGAVLRRTDLEGALSLDLRAGAIALQAERETRRRYWHGR